MAAGALQRVSVVGLGRLGAPLAACLASRGFEVIGADLDAERVARVNAGRAPVFEPGLEELLDRGGRIRATCEIGRAVRDTEATFLVVPTPSQADGRFSNRQLLAACAEVGAALRDRAGHLVVVTSTVMPGSTGGELRTALEHASGRRCGDGFGLCYSPEFVALGSVIRDLFEPDFVLIGESDEAAGDRLESVYARLCASEPPIRRMSFVNAELTKLALNGFVTTKISYANTLAELCERVDGADVDVISGALGLDRRIGAAYLRGGPAYGGPCFPRDNQAFGALARELGLPPLLPEATDAVNRRQGERLLDLVLALRGESSGAVAIVGLAYKPGTDVVVDSPGLRLALGLLGQGVAVRLFDCVALEPTRRALDGRGEYASSVADCCRGADVIALLAQGAEASELVSALRGSAAGPAPVVIDCWRALDPAKLEGVARYVGVGRGLLGAPEAAPSRAGDRR